MIKQKSSDVPVVALTGSIASGKSAVAEVFKELGAHILDADILAREIVVAGSPGLEEIRKRFGDGVLTTDGQLNRRKLGEIIFADPAARADLERITHPKIRELFLRRLDELKNKVTDSQPVVYVVPLFFESGYAYPEIDKIVVVSAERETCIRRIMQRDDCTRELAEKKYDAQLPIEKKEASADFVIKNNSDLKSLREEAVRVFKELAR